MKYVLVYFEPDTSQPCLEESTDYAIFKYKEAKRGMLSCYYQVVNGEKRSYIDEAWFELRPVTKKYLKEVSEDDMFLLCL